MTENKNDKRTPNIDCGGFNVPKVDLRCLCRQCQTQTNSGPSIQVKMQGVFLLMIHLANSISDIFSILLKKQTPYFFN